MRAAAHAVEAVDGGTIAAGSAVDVIACAAPGDDAVGATSPAERVAPQARAALESVVALVEQIVARAAVNPVGTPAAVEAIVAIEACDVRLSVATAAQADD